MPTTDLAPLPGAHHDSFDDEERRSAELEEELVQLLDDSVLLVVDHRHLQQTLVQPSTSPP